MTLHQHKPDIQQLSLSPLQSQILEAILDRKGRKITIIDFEHLETAPARSFIVCEGSSTSQVAAIADNIREEVREKLGIKPYNYDGYRNAQWIVIDYGEVIVHVFVPEFRNYYNLEDLWSDAVLHDLPDLD
ncbi:MAG: ribosome silencing factor [Muribaculaceae bacterium]|nr:ribosome silencing factor [Muribaculaceae bacterium]